MVINCCDWSLMVRSKVNSSSWFKGFDTLYNSHNIWMNYNETTSRHRWNDALGKFWSALVVQNCLRSQGAQQVDLTQHWW